MHVTSLDRPESHLATSRKRCSFSKSTSGYAVFSCCKVCSWTPTGTGRISFPLVLSGLTLLAVQATTTKLHPTSAVALRCLLRVVTFETFHYAHLDDQQNSEDVDTCRGPQRLGHSESVARGSNESYFSSDHEILWLQLT